MQASIGEGDRRKAGDDHTGTGHEARAGHEARPCPIGRASSLLGDRWVLLILREATLGVTRFDAFRENLGIADNILSSGSAAWQTTESWSRCHTVTAAASGTSTG